MDKKATSENIFVVGFPKSGNTWLTRLLADVLDGKVKNGMGGDDEEEIASDINKKTKENLYNIRKTHLLPEGLIRRVDKNLKRAVYIKRDFRDILISSFFYRYPSIKDEDIVKASLLKVFLRNPKRIFLYFRNRLLMYHHIKIMRTKWHGWGDHINEWKEYSDKISFTELTYENLLNNTKGELLKILKKLDLPIPSEDKIEQAIERQAFKNKKKQLENLPEDSKIPFGKKFNVKFLRKGVSGDWKNYLSTCMAKFVHRIMGEALIKNKYVKDKTWCRKFK